MAQEPIPDRADRRTDRAWSRWLGVGTFVVGLLVGALLTGLLGQDPPVPAVGQGAAAVSPPASTAGTEGDRLSPACLQAINAAQDIAAAVEDVGTAAASLDAAQLDQAIRQVQPLQERLRAATADCDVAAEDPSGQAPTASPGAPAPPVPTASPTD